MLARCSPLVFLALSACVIQTLPPAEAPDLTTLERSFDEPWIVIERDLGGHALIEFASRAGSLEGGEPLVAAMVAEAIAERVGAIATVLPGLTLIRKDSTPSTIASDVESLLEALRRPLGEDEIAWAYEHTARLRRAQDAAPSRAAIVAAFEALEIPEAVPLGRERDPLPGRKSLEAFRARLAEPVHTKWIVVGAIGAREEQRLSRLLDREPSDEDFQGGENLEGALPPRTNVTSIGASDPPRRDAPPLRQIQLPRRDRAKLVKGPASWALVAAIPELRLARSMERAVRDRPPFRGTTIGLVPSSSGAFLVISSEGTLDKRRLEKLKSELIRISRPLLPRRAISYRDVGEAIAGVAYDFASSNREGDLVLGLGISEARGEECAAMEHFDADPEFVSLPHEDFGGYGTAIAIRFRRALSDEPRSEAGRTELILEALRRTCLERGLELEILARDGDAIARLHLSGEPDFEIVDAFIECLLREKPHGATFEAARVELLRTLLADPHQELLERLSAALSPSSPSIFFGVESKTVRDRGRTRALLHALDELRISARVDGAVAGELAGAVAEQLGYALASLPKGAIDRPREPSPIGELRTLAPMDGIPVLGVGLRLEIDRGEALRPYLRALKDRLAALGVRVVRAESSTRDEAGFIALILSLGGDDPLALRQRVEEALPDERALREAHIALDYESLLRESGPSARALRLLYRDEDAEPRLPRVVGIIATVAEPSLAH